MTPASLLLDQGLPRDAAPLFREAGFDCIHVGELGMARATDEEILAKAAAEDAVVITLESNSHTILAVTRAGKPSVIRLRIEGRNAAAVVSLVGGVAKRFAAELSQGSFVTVKLSKTTCRSLPIGGP